MSSLNFNPVFERVPELNHAARTIEAWLAERPNLHFIDTQMLSKALGHDVGALQIARVLAQLVVSGQLKIKYRVRLPDGTLSEDQFDSPSAVPKAVPDASLDYFFPERSDIVPVYVMTAATAA